MKGKGSVAETARQRVARNLRTRRVELGLSQEELAGRCGLHRTYVGSIERSERNVSLDNIERLAIAIGVDVIDLLMPT
jgi:transcriptional regulator with XRE-family HTH domain